MAGSWMMASWRRRRSSWSSGGTRRASRARRGRGTSRRRRIVSISTGWVVSSAKQASASVPGLALQERLGEPGVDLAQALPRALRHLGVVPLGELDLEGDQLLGRERQDPVGGEELELPVPRADLLEQRRTGCRPRSASLFLSP